MEDSQFIKEILQRIEAEDPCAFTEFAQEHPLCFQERKGDWLFPMMFDFYTNKICNDKITSLIIELGMALHKSCLHNPSAEITQIDKSLCIDDSYVLDYILKVQKAQSKNPKFKDLNSPWRTIGISLPLFEIPTLLLNSIILEYKDYDHPYILADVAGIYIYSQNLSDALNFLYRSLKQLMTFPNRYWNSELGLAGAVNTFRLLLLMCPDENLELRRKIFMYDYLYLTKLACVAQDEIFQHEAYVNRASIVLSPLARFVKPFPLNPDLLYISDTYYAHYCNETAEYISTSSGWKYNIKSLTFYQHGSTRPNGSGGYAEIEDKTYSEIVTEKHFQAIDIANEFYRLIASGEDCFTTSEVESLFKILLHECRNNYSAVRKRVLNYKSYK